MRISDWSSDVCSSDLKDVEGRGLCTATVRITEAVLKRTGTHVCKQQAGVGVGQEFAERRNGLDVGDVFGRAGDQLIARGEHQVGTLEVGVGDAADDATGLGMRRSEEHTSELKVTNEH